MFAHVFLSENLFAGIQKDIYHSYFNYCQGILYQDLLLSYRIYVTSTYRAIYDFNIETLFEDST